MAAGREYRQYTHAIPMESKDVTLLDVVNDKFGISLPEKISMLRGADEANQLVAVWKGTYECHAFHVDPDKALTDIIERAQQGRSAR